MRPDSNSDIRQEFTFLSPLRTEYFYVDFTSKITPTLKTASNNSEWFQECQYDIKVTHEIPHCARFCNFPLFYLLTEATLVQLLLFHVPFVGGLLRVTLVVAFKLSWVVTPTNTRPID